MGCGKTTVGELLAKKTGRKFIDTDEYIEKKEQMSIPEIFEKKGEAYFRACETQALKELGEAGAVVATGGGALLSEENGSIAKASGTVVFIDTPFEVCYDRIKDDENRPIAISSTKEQLRERYEYRLPLYKKNSTYAVDGSGTPMSIAEAIRN